MTLRLGADLAEASGVLKQDDAFGTVAGCVAISIDRPSRAARRM